VIAVNVDCAEKNGECFVFPISDIPSVVKGKEMNKHHGFYILVPQDVFYVLDNPAVEFYSAHLYSRNQVMLKVPSFPHSLLNHRDEIETVVPDIFTAGLDNSRHYFVDGKARREFKHILLNFPAHFELSASEICGEAGVNESLEMETIKIKFATRGCATRLFSIGRRGRWLGLTLGLTNGESLTCQEKAKLPLR